MGQVILITLIFGSIFTLIGSILAILLQRENKKVTSFLLAFASGSMLSIVFIDLFNELIEQANKINHGVIIALVLVVCFFAFIFFLHQLVDHCTHHSHQDCHVDENHQICHDRAHAHQFLTSMKEGENLFHAGIILFIAMCIHNFPEGISLGVTFKLQS